MSLSKKPEHNDAKSELPETLATSDVPDGPAIERVQNSAMKSLVITDSIQPTDKVKSAKNIRIVPVAPLLSQALLNIWSGTSVSSLFDHEMLQPIYDGMYSAE